jgi:CBS domain-containing protein
MMSIINSIEYAADLSQLYFLRKEAERVLEILVSAGTLASQICKIVSELNDKVVRRVIQFAENASGVSPCTFAWLGLGSEGRQEQTLFTDQDNAIIFEDIRFSKSNEYFKHLSEEIVYSLNECGIPLCRGNVMATNPKFFGSLQQWKERIDYWINNAELSEAELMDAYIFLDFRSIYGNENLDKDLRRYTNELVANNLAFLRSLAKNIVSIPAPIGFFRNFVVEKTGMYKGMLNIKLYGLVPLITCIKILALQNSLMETNTLDRIEGLAETGVISSEHKEALVQAFETFLTLKIQNNLFDGDRERGFGNYVNPTILTLQQKHRLKGAFLAVSDLQKKMKKALRIEEEWLFTKMGVMASVLYSVLPFLRLRRVFTLLIPGS